MQVRRNARFAELTTLGVGGPIDRLVEVSDPDELVAAVRDADAAGRPLLVLDMYEHAYHMDYGAAAARYVDAFMHNVNWEEVERRYEGSLKSRPA